MNHIILFYRWTAVDSNWLRYSFMLQASIFGFVTNSISIITITKCVKLHTSFGILCACLATNNSVLLVLNSVWYLMPDSGIFKAETTLSRWVGMIGLTLWIVGIRLHLLISTNRFIAIVYPFKYLKYVTAARTTVAVGVVIFLSLLQCSPLIIVENNWFCYDRSSIQWSFSPSKFGKFYEAYVINLSNTIELASVFLFDVITLTYLKLNHSKSITAMNSISPTTRIVEIQLFKQAFSQSFPILVTLTFFAFVTPRISDDFAKFLTTTFVWHLAHGVDGLIIDLFHTRLDLFIKKKDQNRSIAVSSSCDHTTVV